MKIIRYSMFDSLPDGNGAEKRTAQITEILTNAKIQSIFIKKDDSIKIKLSVVILKSIPILIQLTKIIPFKYFKNIKSILRSIRNYIQTEQKLFAALNTDASMLLWECTRSENFYVPLLAKKYGKKVITLPHNIESLVPNQVSNISLKKAPDWFNEEVNYLKESNQNFCIAREDTLLLNLFQVKSKFLPYFPTDSVYANLINIRKKREEKSKSNTLTLLMLGSANNQPTFLGMIDRIHFLKKASQLNITLKIAGYKTEVLKNEVKSNDKINLLGTLTNEELTQELTITDVVLIHQQSTTGSLTRIPELLIAGIPILINFESARSYYNQDGIYLYNNDDELIELIVNNKFRTPILISKPIREENIFLKSILS